jgi:hypothetical protein
MLAKATGIEVNYERYRDNNPILLSIVFSENKDIACKFEDI